MDAQNMIDQTAEGPGLVGDLARIAKSVHERIAPGFPAGCTLDRVDATLEDGRCVVTITLTIEALKERVRE